MGLVLSLFSTWTYYYKDKKGLGQRLCNDALTQELTINRNTIADNYSDYIGFSMGNFPALVIG